MASEIDTADKVQRLTLSQWLRLFITYLFVPSLLFLCAWDLAWWQAWAYAVLIVITGIGSHIWAEYRHPGILAERVQSADAQEVKTWDKVLAPLMAISISFPLMIVAGLDHRFGWSPGFATWLNLLGLLLVLFGYAFATWALAENRFFSGTVYIQKERGHEVCDTGPYRYVRHPGYAGNLIPLLGIVLALDSLWTLIPAAVAAVITLIRTVLEDRTLLEELPGYREYAGRVRYRLFPWVY